MEREASSAQLIANRSMPPGSIIPELAYDDVSEATAWLCRAFGFRERLRIGKHRVQLVHGGAAIVVVEGARGAHAKVPPGPITHSVMIRVADVDGHYKRVKAAGGHITSEPSTYPFGERQYSAMDPWGHVWTFSQSVADVDPSEWGGQAVDLS